MIESLCQNLLSASYVYVIYVNTLLLFDIDHLLYAYNLIYHFCATFQWEYRVDREIGSDIVFACRSFPIPLSYRNHISKPDYMVQKWLV